MPNLIREQRVDKNGVLNTKLVSAAPKASKAALRVPAPSVGSSASSRAKKIAEKPFKPRPAQVQKQFYSLAHGSYRISPELLVTMPFAVPSGQSTFYSFEASEVEVYDVLSVTTPGDAMELLQRGVRTAADATKYLNRRKMKMLVKDYGKYSEEAIKRNISSYKFMECFDATKDSEMESPYFMDALELRCSSSLSDQYHWIKDELLAGEMRMEDIKAIGFAKLKPFRRLYYSRHALDEMNKPDAKFNIDDLKAVVDQAIEEGIKERVYKSVMDYLIHEGPEFLKSVSSFKELGHVDVNHSMSKDRFERTKYELEFRALDGSRFRAREVVTKLYEQGIPPADAVPLIKEGVPIDNIAGIVNGGIERSLAEGWL
jgi:hypothetical protein